MLYGKAVNTTDFSRIQLFCPDLMYIEFVPSYGDNYIINAAGFSLKAFRERFCQSVLISPAGFDLSNRTAVMESIGLSKTAQGYFESMHETEFWNNLRIYTVCGRYKKELDESSIYPLFKTLGGSVAEVIGAYEKVAHLPIQLVFSGILTFLIKMKNLKEISVSGLYKLDLTNVARRVSDPARKVMRYLKSDREQSDFLSFLVSL